VAIAKYKTGFMLKRHFVSYVIVAVFCGWSAVAVADDSASTKAWVNAIEARDVKALAVLREEGFMDVNLTNGQGKTALMVAAQSGASGLSQTLVATGAKINVENDNGGTPLMHAAVGGNIEIVALLLSAGAKVNTEAVNGWTALALASAKGYVPVINQLLDAGADPNLSDIFGWTPLMHAVEQERRDAVAVLLRQPQIHLDFRNVDGVTALHRAAAQGFSEISRMLVRAGASPNLPDQTGRTALDYAREAGQPEILKDLSS